VNGQTLLKAKDGNVDFEDKGNSRPLRGVSLPGSAMGILRIASAPNPLGSIKDLFGKNIASFELLSTDALKTQSARSRSIGRRGENMAGFSADLYRDTQARINERMQEFCPGVQRIYVDQDLPSKLYRQHIREDLLTEAVASSHFGDGFTRILAIVTQIESSTVPDRMLLIDGIEDGIHPELLPKLIGYLAGSNAQVIATTQSPIVLNCLPEDEARESVIFLYRNGEGRSRSCRYFDLPSANSKLGILRPGEIFADTAAAQLAREAEEMERAASTRE